MATAGRQEQPLNWGEIAGFALLAVVVGVLIFSGRGASSEAIPAGTPLPELMAEGWINSDVPISRDSLANKVVVVDCWATWCAPCRAAMPDLAKLYKVYHSMGVEFVGLTSEPASDRATIENFVQSVKDFDWPVGYGASPTLDQLGITGWPTVIVFAPGKGVVWSSNDLYGIEAAIEQELSELP